VPGVTTAAAPARNGWVVAGLVVLFAAVSAMVVLPRALGTPEISVFDEASHADWVWHLAHGQLVTRGDTMTPEVLAEWSCRGWAWPGLDVPSCDTVPNDPASYSSKGINYNHFHAPAYYALTAVGAVVVGWFAPGTDIVTAGRAVGVVWMVASMAGVFAVARVLGARRWVSAAAGVVAATLPLVVHLHAIVTNDAAVVAVGALVVGVAVRCVHTPVRWWWLAAVGVVAGLTKVVMLPAVVAAVVVLVAMAWLGPAGQLRRLVVAAAALVAGFVAATSAWLGLQVIRAPDTAYVDPVPGDVTGDGVVSAIVGSAFDTLPPTAGRLDWVIGGPGPAAQVWQGATDAVLLAVPVVLVAIGAITLVVRRRRQTGDVAGDVAGDDAGSDAPYGFDAQLAVALGVAIVVGLVAGALAINTQHYLAKGSAMSVVHPRYGLAVLAALLGGLAMMAERWRVTRLAMGAAAAAGVVVTVADRL
jgi:hypothetical protein